MTRRKTARRNGRARPFGYAAAFACGRMRYLCYTGRGSLYCFERNQRGGNRMASTKEYLDFILEQLSLLDGISHRAMMGEYVLYYRGKVVGGIYDDRFLVKPTASAVSMLPEAARETPYEGAKEMLLVDRIEDREFLRDLLESMAAELPAPKKKR